MVPSVSSPDPVHDPRHSHACGHDHAHSPDRAHGHAHGHSHGPSAPHPAQAAPWSILRMTVVSRMAAALAVSAGLWAAVLLAMR